MSELPCPPPLPTNPSVRVERWMVFAAGFVAGIIFSLVVGGVIVWIRPDLESKHIRTETWTKGDFLKHSADEPYASFTDTYDDRRPSSYHREAVVYADKETLYITGTLTTTGMKHGEWRTEWVTSAEREKPRPKYEWYWYGEQISEGEWHLRNK